MDVLTWLEAQYQAIIADVAAGHTFKVIFFWFTACMMIELCVYLVRRKPWTRGEALSNLFSTAIEAFVLHPVISVGYVALYILIYEQARLFTIPTTPWGLLGVFLIWETCHYAQHRLSHRTGLFWAVHQVHHSAQEMNITTAARKFWFWSLGFEPVYLLMALAGVSFVQFSIILLLINLFGILHHTRLVGRLGVLEDLIITPANHRVHHGVQTKYLDKNYGQVLAIFDRVFGSFQKEEEEPVYGLVEQLNTNNPFKFQIAGVMELWGLVSSAPRWSDKLLYLVKPPGWRHDREHKTVEAIVARARQAQGQEAPLSRAANKA